MQKSLSFAAVFITVPLIANIGRSLGWWNIITFFDIYAHFSVSLGLAIGIGALLQKLKGYSSCFSIVLLVILIGGVWELYELVLNQLSYISNAEAIKDLSVDLIGAIIGGMIITRNRRG